MLIIYDLKNDDLHLDAYSHSRNDLKEMSALLDRANISYEVSDIRSDKAGRRGLKFRVDYSSINRIENLLRVKFVATRGSSVKLRILHTEEGESYSCKSINGGGCVEIKAQGDGVAMVKCGAIARSKGWRGGISRKGYC